MEELTLFRLLSDRFLDLVFPPKCFGCGTPVESEMLFCRRCGESFLRFADICARCLKKQSRCICRRLDPCYLEGIALYAYEGGVRRGIHAFKYHGAERYGRLLGERLGKRCGSRWGARMPFDGVTYVPMHPKKISVRGYQPARLLALHCAEVLALPLVEGCLCHTGNRKAQSACTTAVSRKENADRSFVAPTKAAALSGRSLLLVDDVMTTGSTINRCAEILCQQGAQVYIGVVGTTFEEDVPVKKPRESPTSRSPRNENVST